MALNAGTVWEFRTTGNNNNAGGFYNRTPGTSVDYSQQDAAQLELSDLAMVTGGTTLTSATGGFTAAMVGNIIYIRSGTNFTAGFYEITARADTNTVTLDRDATNGSNGSSGTGSVGGARALLTDAFCEILIAGNTVYLKAGTYTQSESFSMSVSGTSENVITFIGYNSSRGDNPTVNDRPLIAAAAYLTTFADYIQIKNFRLTNTTINGLSVGSYCIVNNCKSENTSSTASRTAFYCNNYTQFIDCEGVSTNGPAFSIAAGSVCICCYGHDSASGILLRGNSAFIADCVNDTCVTGIDINSRLGTVVKNCSIYGSTTGVSGTTGHRSILINNIINSCTTGVSWSTLYKNHWSQNNNWYGNTADVSNFEKGIGETAVDPEFTNAGSGDFSLKTTSDCIGAGFGIRLGV